MANRSIVVELRAQIADFKGKFEQAGKAAGDLAGRLEKAQGSIDKVGSAATKGGLVIAAGLVAAGKAAMDWESAWAGVTKTVDGSATQLAALEGELRNMARTMPATHDEIAAVAEAAGQLGVRTEDVAGFTRVMIDLGETTNLTADEAATSLAQFMNVMGTSADDVSRLGAAVVDLGNKGASTERDIVQMGQRIAAAGKAAGMSETDVLGFASALASVGVEAEAGGTAISMSFTQIGQAVRKGGDELDVIAKTAGMSAAEFRRAWGEDAAGATQSFVEGLGTMQTKGEDARGVLEALGMTGIRQSDSLMRLALAGKLLGDNLDNAAGAWDANSALAAEAGKRYATTESQMRIAWNNIKDAAIDAGGVLLPMVADIARGAADMARGFSELPGPVKAAGTGFGVMAAGGLLAVGGLSKLLTTGLGLRSSLRELADVSPKLAGHMGTLGKAAGIAAGAMALLVAGQVVRQMTNITLSVEDAAVALERFGDGAADLDGAFNGAEFGITSLDDALRTLGSNDGWDKFRGGVQELTGLGGDIVEAKESVAALDAALVQMSATDAGAAFQKISERAAELGITVEQLAVMFPQYAARLQEQAREAGKSATSTQALAMASKEAASAAESHTEAMIQQANAALKLSGSEIGLEAAIDDATAAVKENGATLDINTEKGRANRTALNGIASSAEAVRQAQLEAKASTDTMNASTQRARDAFVATAQQMGYTRARAEALADSYGLIPRSVHTNVTATMADINVGAYIARLQSRVNANPVVIPVRSSVSIARASGGPVYGAGTTTSDSIPAMLSNREFVQQASAHDYYGSGVMWALNQKRIPREVFAPLGFAGGGSPSSLAPVPMVAASGGASGPIRVQSGDVSVRVFLGGRELTDVVRTEIQQHESTQVRRGRQRAGVTG